MNKLFSQSIVFLFFFHKECTVLFEVVGGHAIGNTNFNDLMAHQKTRKVKQTLNKPDFLTISSSTAFHFMMQLSQIWLKKHDNIQTECQTNSPLWPYKISTGRMGPTAMCALAAVQLMKQNDILCVGPRQLWAHRGHLVRLMRLEREVRNDSQSK